MGWLRDLMEASSPPFRSFGALARRALASPDWPAGTAPQPRSLAALFSKLDRRIELEWLADRPAVQRVLAECLGRPLAEITGVLGPAASPLTDATSRFRFEDAPYVQPLDLLREGLCPGFPPELTLPATWGRLWWHAPPGSGRALVGAWLEARGLCHVVRAATLDAALASAPAHGPVWLEIDQIDDRALAALDARGPRSGICLAARQAPTSSESDFRVVVAPEPLMYLDDFVTWVARRLPEDGHFDEVASKRWLRSVAEAGGVLESLGTLLGLCGALDAIDPKKLGQGSVDKLAGLYFNAQLTLAQTEDAPVVAWLRRQGLPVVVGLASRLLVDATEPWETPREFDAWLDLVPLEYQRGGDLEWMRLALADSDSPVRPGDLAKAAKRMPPGAYRVVRGLERAQLLRPAAAGLLKLAPRWLGVSAVREARRQLLRGSPVEWGEALLNRRETPHLLAELRRFAAAQDFDPFEAALELEGGREPASVACIEASFVTLGLALLDGVELPQDLVEGVWNEQLAALVELDDELPRQRLVSGDPLGSGGAEPPLPNAAFHLAALALAEQLPVGVGQRHPLLDPWREAKPPAGLGRLYDGIERALATHPELGEFESATVALVDRLRNTFGQVAATLHALEAAGSLLDEIEHDVLSPDALARAVAAPRGTQRLRGLAERRDVAWSRVSEACWNTWRAAREVPALTQLFDPRSEIAGWFWASLPVPLLQEFLSGALDVPGGANLPYAHFGEEHWQALLEGLERGSLPHDVHQAWRELPEAALDAALARPQELGRAGALPSLWSRHGQQLLAHLEHATRDRRVGDVVELIE
ncbi:MAG TPA: hypothetical protein VI197_34315, partial [Polyangiaceae bacterium]